VEVKAKIMQVEIPAGICKRSCDEHTSLRTRASVQYQSFFFSGRLPQARNTGKALRTKNQPPPTGYHVLHSKEGVAKCANGTV
jgi:hypothetical protein